MTVDQERLAQGLTKLRDGIAMIRDAQDEIRMACMKSEGDQYHYIDLACAIVSQTTSPLWQIYERLRMRFRT